MKKILFTATVTETHIKVFHIPFLKWFKDRGYEVHVAARGKNDIPYCDKFFNIPFERSPLKKDNLKAYRELKTIITENKYEIIHCHTPMGGVLTRLAAKSARKAGTKVLYTAHGFHFFEGAPEANWKIYYPVEKWLSKYTDCLITINAEDYEIANRDKFNAGSIELVNGVGIDLEKFTPQTDEIKNQLRKEYGFNKDDFILMYAGEMSYRKHQDLLINAISILKGKIPNIKLLLAGTGELLEQYSAQVDSLGVNGNIEFLGFRKDIAKLMMISDLAVSTSRQEGLPVNVMEAMATGLPLVVTNCRGNRDLVSNGENGYVVDIDEVEGLVEAINKLYESKEQRQQFGINSLELVKNYSLENVLVRMDAIYNSFLK